MTTLEEAASGEPAQRAARGFAAAAPGFATGLIGLVAAGVALLSALVTFVVMADLTPISPTHYVVLALLLANALTVLLLIIIIGREVWHIVQARRRGWAAASRSSACSR
jgi:two-component system nitrogen regulation sensor histidine kinase NtrY